MNEIEINLEKSGKSQFRGEPKNLSFWNLLDRESTIRLQESIHENGRELAAIWEWLEWQQLNNPEQAQINAGVIAAIGLLAAAGDDMDTDSAFMMFDQIARICEMLNQINNQLTRRNTAQTKDIRKKTK